MTREEAREFLLSIANQLGCIGVENLTDRDGDRMRDAIQALEEPQWIPCSVKYPEADERVFVTTVDHDYYVWDCMSNRGDSYFWEDEEGFYHNKYEVVAWRHLPEPWGGDAE